jgi:hypothetical protein
MSKVHDNTIVGYTVDGHARRILLRTEAEGSREKIDVVFEGVEAYSFRHDCFGNIVLHICEMPLDEALQAHWSELDAGHRESGWPPFWQGEESKTRARIAALVEQGAKWFELTSSYGMKGWVFCRSIDYRVTAP